MCQSSQVFDAQELATIPDISEYNESKSGVGLLSPSHGKHQRTVAIFCRKVYTVIEVLIRRDWRGDLPIMPLIIVDPLSRCVSHCPCLVHSWVSSVIFYGILF